MNHETNPRQNKETYFKIYVLGLWLGVVQPFICVVLMSFRDSLAAQLEITLTKADSEQLARSIAEEQYSDLEKEKIMKELEIKDMMARHRQELSDKEATISSVRPFLLTRSRT